MMLTLNSERWFGRGVLEALKDASQSVDLRLLVVDGGSTDETIKRIKETFGDRASILRYERRNIAAARNFALENAPEADFYCWIDSDIVIPRNFFDRLLPLFEDEPVGTAEVRAALSTRSIVARYYNELRGAKERGIRPTREGATTCLVMRPEVASEIRLDERFARAGEDVHFHYRVLEKGYKLIVDLNDPPALHVRDSSLPDEMKRLLYRGMARALNVKLHSGVIPRGQRVARSLTSAFLTLASWTLAAWGLAFGTWVATLPLLMLVGRHALKLKRAWKIHLAFVGLLLSTAYLTGFLIGYFRHLRS